MKKEGFYAILILLCGICLSLLFYSRAPETEGLEEAIGYQLPLLSVIPFILLLLSIALFPLLAPDWWDQNQNKALITVLLGTPVFLYYLFLGRGTIALWNQAHEFYSFIVLLGALFTISGGIHLRGDLRATPLTNTSFLAVGGIIASIIGTTGAAMLLIRALISTNSERQHTRHIFVFFLFITANAGGLLTPLGDPPLFLGFLRGVPFFWTMTLWKEWLSVSGILLLLFYLFDRHAYWKEDEVHRLADRLAVEPIRLWGMVNIPLLIGVMAVVVFVSGEYQWLREPALLILALASYLLDIRQDQNPAVSFHPRKANRFNFHPILEVALLFAGIFITMLPVLCLLKAHGSELGITTPWQFFWLAGALSSFLDNAPTYATFFALGQGLASQSGLCQTVGNLGSCVAHTGIPTRLLEAISLGSVLMGANTYIGNAPNFMVKTIVEQSGTKMPSFFGYMAYSIAILIPIYLLITFLFL